MTRQWSKRRLRITDIADVSTLHTIPEHVAVLICHKTHLVVGELQCLREVGRHLQQMSASIGVKFHIRKLIIGFQLQAVRLFIAHPLRRKDSNAPSIFNFFLQLDKIYSLLFR